MTTKADEQAERPRGKRRKTGNRRKGGPRWARPPARKYDQGGGEGQKGGLIILGVKNERGPTLAGSLPGALLSLERHSIKVEWKSLGEREGISFPTSKGWEEREKSLQAARKCFEKIV